VVGSAAFTGLGQADAARPSLGAGLTTAGLRAQGGPQAPPNAVLVVGRGVTTDQLAERVDDAPAI
jgi:hypothetical protein